MIFNRSTEGVCFVGFKVGIVRVLHSFPSEVNDILYKRVALPCKDFMMFDPSMEGV